MVSSDRAMPDNDFLDLMRSNESIKAATIESLVDYGYDSLDAFMALDVDRDLPQLKLISLGQRSIIRRLLAQMRADESGDRRDAQPSAHCCAASQLLSKIADLIAEANGGQTNGGFGVSDRHEQTANNLKIYKNAVKRLTLENSSLKKHLREQSSAHILNLKRAKSALQSYPDVNDRIARCFKHAIGDETKAWRTVTSSAPNLRSDCRRTSTSSFVEISALNESRRESEESSKLSIMSSNSLSEDTRDNVSLSIVPLVDDRVNNNSSFELSSYSVDNSLSKVDSIDSNFGDQSVIKRVKIDSDEKKAATSDANSANVVHIPLDSDFSDTSMYHENYTKSSETKENNNLTIISTTLNGMHCNQVNGEVKLAVSSVDSCDALRSRASNHNRENSDFDHNKGYDCRIPGCDFETLFRQKYDDHIQNHIPYRFGQEMPEFYDRFLTEYMNSDEYRRNKN